MKTHNFLGSRCAAACVFALFLPLAQASQTVRGVPNLQTVNENVLRGGQPTEEGFRNLAARGVKTIVDLRKRDDRSRAEEKLVKSLGMRYVSIPMKGMHTPTEQQISRAMHVLRDESAAPVFVHCQRGADRTGVVVACYRIQHDNWDNPKALEEARGYGMRWYEFPLKRYVLSYKGTGKSETVADAATPAEAVK